MKIHHEATADSLYFQEYFYVVCYIHFIPNSICVCSYVYVCVACPISDTDR